MKNTTKKVVILDNITSPYIQQAIIVLKDYVSVSETKIISDAEKIVNEYLEKNWLISDNTKQYLKSKKKKNKNKALLFISFSALLIGTVVLFHFI